MEKYNYWRAFKRYELKEMVDCIKRIKDDEQNLEELRGKHVIMFMGNTGSGKSTIVNGIVSGAK